MKGTKFMAALKKQTARLLCHPLIGRVIGRCFGHVVPNRGCRIDTRHASILPSTVASLFWGFYESAESRFVARYLPRDLDVVELGASLGAVSAQIARRLHGGRRLISVEANPALIDLIALNVRGNAPHVVHEVVHGAISDGTASYVSFALADENIASALAVAADCRRVISVPVLTLGRLLAKKRIGDFTLVSDIEGAEALLLESDAASLDRCHFILIELHPVTVGPRPLTVDQLRARIESLGFSLVASRGAVCAFEKRADRLAPVER